MNTPLALNSSQLTVVRRTIAKDCDNAEFDLFLEAAKSYGLDPFRKQIIPLVFAKDKPDKRRMSIVVTRDGLRVMASRCGDYRPASEPAHIVYDDNLKGPTNPKGIVSASVKLWKQDNKGEWYPVIGEAYWDEFAPVADEWAYDQQAGKRRPTGKKVLDASGNWARMPIVMIVKCAESQALRGGWPETFSGVYVEEEMDRARTLDATASEIVEQEEKDRRLALTSGKDTVLIQWLPDMPMEAVPLGQMADRAIEWIKDPSRSLDDLERFHAVNRVSLQNFWARSKNDALEVNTVLEDRTAGLAKREQAA
ncbi:MAG: phage recombination protein Bet [Roseibium sp.]|nr:phage recombination protein Bet [Roseibium sp.]